jgi:hypothetical protein
MTEILPQHSTEHETWLHAILVSTMKLLMPYKITEAPILILFMDYTN